MALENILDALKIAASLHMSNEFQKAHDLYREIILIDPNNAHALHLLGVLLLQNGFHKDGKNFVEQAIEIRGDYPEAVANLASFGCSVPAKWQLDIDQFEKVTGWNVYENESTDRWRHLRMLDFANCFLGSEDLWLTIGDFRGHDSLMLRSMGISNVVASNLDVAELKLGHDAGVVGDYLTINAEKISLPDDSFDYVLCKEALHHMPRPILAIYEMLRVARKGIVFVEPQDKVIDWPANKKSTFWHEVEGGKVSFGKNGEDVPIAEYLVDWHEDGVFNYVYTMSKREVHKISLGMGLPAYATKSFNDYYNAEWASQPATQEHDGFNKTVEQIQLWDHICKLTGSPSSYMTGLLFKRHPNQDVAQKLRSLGYEFNVTPTRFLPLKWPNF
ncbi:MAG: methyltransferase domain-containing protein [Gallionellaceae bacterium]|jgi:SAM-dependent methyltransferase